VIADLTKKFSCIEEGMGGVRKTFFICQYFGKRTIGSLYNVRAFVLYGDTHSETGGPARLPAPVAGTTGTHKLKTCTVRKKNYFLSG
jgi:hypothetical protein